MTFTFLSAAALFVAVACAALWHLRWMRRLPTLEDLNEGGASAAREPIRCSVIVAARNEEARLEETVRRLLAQRGVELELIVVDDRSTDRTAAILEQLAKEDARLRVLRIDALPEGWLGKCHACHIGALAAQGEWILFTDADCWLKPDVVRRALLVAEREQAEHVTLSSGLAVPGPGFRAGSLMFHLSLANWFSGVNRDRPKAHLGLGAFNLVRASAYRQCGGYEALRLTVLDDVKLGLLLRRAGKRTRAFLGANEVEAYWGTCLWDVVPIMEKNYFAALEFSLPLALGVIAFLTLLMGAAILGAASRTATGLAAALSSFFLAIPAAILARRMGWSWSIALGVPFVMPVFVWALLNSTFKTLWRGGIRWRDTFYALETLRAGSVR
ncbi:MAG TPA: glycosyltransferase family 2 protein [Verrucomicrobiae bacterium]